MAEAGGEVRERRRLPLPVKIAFGTVLAVQASLAVAAVTALFLASALKAGDIRKVESLVALGILVAVVVIFVAVALVTWAFAVSDRTSLDDMQVESRRWGRGDE